MNSVVVREEVHRIEKKPIVDLSASHINAYFVMSLAGKLGKRLGFNSEKINSIQREMLGVVGYNHIIGIFKREFDSYVNKVVI